MLLNSGVPAATSTALATTVGTNASGRQAATELLDHDHQLLESVSGPAELLGYVQAEPAESGGFTVEVGNRFVARFEERRGPPCGTRAS